MISFDIGAYRFQVRAAAIFVWNESVLLHRLVGEDFWALPGGRADPGEHASTTVVREMREELDEAVTCGPLAFVVENFFEHRGQPNHELGFYFRATLADDSRLLDAACSHRGAEGDQALEFRWFALAGIAAIDLRPSFLRAALVETSTGCHHIVQRG